MHLGFFVCSYVIAILKFCVYCDFHARKRIIHQFKICESSLVSILSNIVLTDIAIAT